MVMPSNETKLRQALISARYALLDVKAKLKVFEVAPWPWLLTELDIAEKIIRETSDVQHP